MLSSELHVHILYCNGREAGEPPRRQGPLVRTLQHHELLLFTEGAGRATLGSGRKGQRVGAGTLLYLSPGLPHTLELDERSPLAFLSVHFECAQVRREEERWTVEPREDRLVSQHSRELKDYYQIEEQFRALVAGWKDKLPGYEFAARSRLEQLMLAIAQNARRQRPNHALSLRVERTIAYMHERLEDRVTLAELADNAGVSTFYLSRAFREATGCSVIGYFNRIKMDRAKELLLENGSKVKEVARALGFADEFYFSRLFKRMEGVSPSEFSSKNVHGV